MDSQTHRKEFEKVVIKYHFNDKDKAEEIAKYLTRNLDKQISSKEFATLFAMEETDAIIFLSFIQQGLEFKEGIA